MDHFKDLLKYILVGAIGFSLGEFYYYMSSLDYRTPFIPTFIREVFRAANFGAAICGMFLGVANRDSIKGIKMAVGGLLGFATGSIILYPIFLITALLTGGAETLEILAIFITSALLGIIGSAFYGVVQMEVKKSFIFAVAGGLGVSIGAVAGILFIEQTLVSFMAFSLITGSFLGAGMYFAEKEE
jgi:hypothetical protein